MSKDIHCPIIHNGISIRATTDPNKFKIGQCCLRIHGMFEKNLDEISWKEPKFIPLIETNKQNKWDPQCGNCSDLEKSGLKSYRQGMLERWGIEERLSGPRRIDILFNISCNLACRICGSHSSTYWQKHLKENNLPIEPFIKNKSGKEAIELLKKFDLSHLQSIVFGGGETLMGNDHWEVLEFLSTLPHAKESLMVSFQTNGTQTIPDKRYELLEKFHLVKLHFSIDGIEERFNYQRWPADWNQVKQNLFEIRDNAPGNVMFLIEETIGLLNLAYIGEVAEWRKENFSTNREGDPVDHTHHTAFGLYSLLGCTEEYVDFARKSLNTNMITPDWQEDPELIKKIISEIKKFDSFRNQSFQKSLPEVAKFYKRYL